MGASPQDETKRWKNALEKVKESKRTTFADVVHAAVTFDRGGRIQMDFDADDSNYRISSLQEQAKQCVKSFHTSKQVAKRTSTFLSWPSAS
ncbi:hypothetical protein V7S43_004368 [Phytophthora oleae]|uniref:PH domain-containing protein n=1 Tax=Phytophthora oleae TaxID=2107226 RepID=A0ABD3FWP6_9STRA